MVPRWRTIHAMHDVTITINFLSLLSLSQFFFQQNFNLQGVPAKLAIASDAHALDSCNRLFQKELLANVYALTQYRYTNNS